MSEPSAPAGVCNGDDEESSGRCKKSDIPHECLLWCWSAAYRWI